MYAHSTHTHTHTHIQTHASKHACTHTHTRACMHAHKYTARTCSKEGTKVVPKWKIIMADGDYSLLSRNNYAVSTFHATALATAQ